MILITKLSYAESSFPLIIMGGVWEKESKPHYSNLSRVCNIGFTHVFSYITEPNIGEERSLSTQMVVSKQFANTVKSFCPKLGLVMGIPSEWIYQNRLDLIGEYIESLSGNGIHVNYWLSDEVINGMINNGMSLESATNRAASVIAFVENKSHVSYIWIEPGNYGTKYASILNNISKIQPGIKSYDQYIISKYNRLSNAVDKFNLLNRTLINLKKDNKVFPVCEIGSNDNKFNYPTESEFDSILISLLMNHADGFVFWEERWTSNETLLSLASSLKKLKQIRGVGVNKFSLISSSPLVWKVKDKDITIMLNNTNESIMISQQRFLAPTMSYTSLQQ